MVKVSIPEAVHHEVSMATRISGIFTPNIVPLDERAQINEVELRRYVEWLIVSGVHGLYPNGSTGEFVRFSPEERVRIVEIVCDQARGRVPVLAGAAEANVRETLRACEKYLDFGASSVAIVSPYYYRLGPSAVCAYFSEIARNTPIDITLYNIPIFASPIDVPTLQRLAEFPRIVGLKDSSGDVSQMLRMMAAIERDRPDFAFLAGWEPALVAMLAIGCSGATLALSGVVPEVTRAIYNLTIAGRQRAARALQIKLIELFDLIIYGMDFPDGVRASVALRGFDVGASRQPSGDCPTFDRNRIARLMDELLADARSNNNMNDRSPSDSNEVPNA